MKRYTQNTSKTVEPKKKRIRPHGSIQTQERRLAAIAFSGDMKTWRSSVKGKDLF